MSSIKDRSIHLTGIALFIYRAYREAKKMGLDIDDEIIRRRLSQKFDFLQTDLARVKEPSEGVLNQFYLSHPELFRKEATVSFTHIYFSTGGSTDTVAKQRAAQVLLQLNKSSLRRAPEKGDRFPLQYDYTDQSMLDLRQNFGDKALATALFDAPVTTWIGPFQSGYGWHLAYIMKRDCAALRPYVEVKNEVRSQFLDAEKNKLNKEMFDRIAKNYIIDSSYLDAK